MNSEVADAIENYYKLKQKYEASLYKKKQKILSNQSLNTNAKKQKIREIRKTCVNCGNLGGTVFKTKDNTLMAVCGSSTPCDLNINIKRGYFTNIRTECYTLYSNFNNLQTNIIATKLDILFGYKTEDEAIKIFKKLRKDLSSVVKLYNVVRKEYLDIVARGYGSQELKDKQNKLQVAIDEIKELSKTYDKIEDSYESGSGIIKDMVEKYIDEIVPTVSEIRDLAYVISKIENITVYENDKPKEITKLIQEPYTIENLYISGLEKAQIISNTYR
tara:strand:- start:730 stop:1551 length:822 start_codon:yes stop_codon:yes gene_type:complete